MRIAGVPPKSAPRTSLPGDGKDRHGFSERELTQSFQTGEQAAVATLRHGSSGAGVAGPALETVTVKGDKGEPGLNGSPGAVGPSDRMSGTAILIDTTPYTYTPSDAVPVTLWVYVGASGDAVALTINAGTNSAGKKILVVNGQRGGHKNLLAVVCNAGTAQELTDTLVDGSDALEAIVIAFPAGGSSPIPPGGATMGETGTTTTEEKMQSEMVVETPVAAQLRVQVVSVYHAEAADTDVGGMQVLSGEILTHGV